jgi:hypothetical protein
MPRARRLIRFSATKAEWEHRLVAERVLGKKLPTKAVIHHVDKNGFNNNLSNLVICENQAYHKFLHKRQDALRACGNKNWIKCNTCGIHDYEGNMNHDYRGRYWHKECAARKRRFQ